MTLLSPAEQKALITAALSFLLASGVILFDSSYGNGIPVFDEWKTGSRKKLDINRASFQEILSLPGVSPDTARQLIESRRSLAFRSPQDLLLISGFGPLLIKKVEPCLYWSDSPQRTSLEAPLTSQVVLKPSSSGGACPGPSNNRNRDGVTCPSLDLNKASVKELENLSGVGHSLATRIVSYRQTHGPFQEVSQLKKIRGIGATRLRSLQETLFTKNCARADDPGNTSRNSLPESGRL